MKFLKKLFKKKEKITLQEFADRMVFWGNSLFRGEKIRKLITEARKTAAKEVRGGNREKIHLELISFRYWVMCYLIQVVLKPTGCDWEKAVDEFEKNWITLLARHEDMDDSLLDRDPSLLSSKEYLQTLIDPFPLSYEELLQFHRERTIAYDKAFTEGVSIEEKVESKATRMQFGRYGQVAKEFLKNLGMEMDARYIFNMIFDIVITIKSHSKGLEETIEQTDLSFLEKQCADNSSDALLASGLTGDWKYFYADEAGDSFYDTQSVSRGQDTTRVLVKTVLSDKAKADFIKEFQDKSGIEKICLIIHGWEIHCSKNRDRTLFLIWCSSDGKVIYSSDYPDEKFREVVPDSVGEALAKILCGKHAGNK
jgi:hypothetical protein